MNWNQAQLSLACLESLERQDLAPGQQMDCLIVDNGSDDDSRQVFEKALDHRSRGKKDRRLHSSGTRPAVSLLLLAENRGFAGGMNAGIRHALESGYDHVLILNNDTLADWNMVRELLNAMRVKQVGMVAPTIYRLQPFDAALDQDLSVDPPHYDREGRMSDLAPVWPSAGWRKEASLDAIDTTAQTPRSAPYAIDWMTGCCMLMRAELVSSVGVFDEGFYMYYEDHDLCLRAKAAGWDLLHVPAARLGHRVAASSGTNSSEQRYMMARSSVRYYQKHTAGAQVILILATRSANLLLTMLRTLSKGDWRGAAAYIAGLRQGFRDLSSPAAVQSSRIHMSDSNQSNTRHEASIQSKISTAPPPALPSSSDQYSSDRSTSSRNTSNPSSPNRSPSDQLSPSRPSPSRPSSSDDRLLMISSIPMAQRETTAQADIASSRLPYVS